MLVAMRKKRIIAWKFRLINGLLQTERATFLKGGSPPEKGQLFGLLGCF